MQVKNEDPALYLVQPADKAAARREAKAAWAESDDAIIARAIAILHGWCEPWRADEQVWPTIDTDTDLSQPAALEAVDSAISQLLGE